MVYNILMVNKGHCMFWAACCDGLFFIESLGIPPVYFNIKDFKTSLKNVNIHNKKKYSKQTRAERFLKRLFL